MPLQIPKDRRSAKIRKQGPERRLAAEADIPEEGLVPQDLKLRVEHAFAALRGEITFTGNQSDCIWMKFVHFLIAT